VIDEPVWDFRQLACPRGRVGKGQCIDVLPRRWTRLKDELTKSRVERDLLLKAALTFGLDDKGDL